MFAHIYMNVDKKKIKKNHPAQHCTLCNCTLTNAFHRVRGLRVWPCSWLCFIITLSPWHDTPSAGIHLLFCGMDAVTQEPYLAEDSPHLTMPCVKNKQHLSAALRFLLVLVCCDIAKPWRYRVEASLYITKVSKHGA